MCNYIDSGQTGFTCVFDLLTGVTSAINLQVVLVGVLRQCTLDWPLVSGRLALRR